MKNPLVSVIIPTKNSEFFLEKCLKSLREQTYRNIEIIIVDNYSIDRTKEIAKKYSDQFFTRGPERAAQRKFGSSKSKGQILIHFDSDMVFSKELVENCVDLMREYEALVIPEKSFGSNFWSKCKELEKVCYEGNSNIESLRVLTRDLYFKVGGHDKRLIFSEDKDLDLRIRALGVKIGRAKYYIYHDEGSFGIFQLVKKKLSYSKTGNLFKNKHPDAFAWQSNLLNRYKIFLKNYKLIKQYKFVYLGLFFLKSLEFVGGGFGYLLTKFKNDS